MVVDRKYENDYVLYINGIHKTYHINLLKKYVSRETQVTAGMFEAIGNDEASVPINEMENEQDDNGEFGTDRIEFFPDSQQKEFIEHIKINKNLSADQKKELFELVARFQDTFTDVPKKTHVSTCKINLTSDQPIRSKPYHLETIEAGERQIAEAEDPGND